MSSSSDDVSSSNCSSRSAEKRYKGIRCRRWGKWVSEIRVPGTQERLWLGTYTTPEGAAVAHDVASYCLKGATSLHKLNFPSMLPPTARTDLSPRSVQKAASDAGMAMDAQLISSREMAPRNGGFNQEGQALSISVDDYL
ncbi:ethylene-responsive transcription factor ERF019 [Lactuca sativa]|uniref:ethylene-responsive transcription factor ERF019 n=1 Tax=Lactuca sativa TaxID=4236 RepID=UPI000CB3EE24|nr:ethylene-responsive transcription factor ERF019 [Lactuca sativa]